MFRKILNNRIINFTLIISLVAILVCIGFPKYQEVTALSKYGSQGDEVKQIQEKLKSWGYYSR